MSWRFVFNTQNLGVGKTLEQIANLAESIGYEFFTFNGDVYFVSAGMHFKTTIKVEDLN
jgi:hypothetical protein